MISTHDLAARLGIHVSTIRRAIKRGQLPATAARGHNPAMVTEADADAYCVEYLRSHTCAACGQLKVRCGANGMCDPCTTNARKRAYALKRAAMREARRAAAAALRAPSPPPPPRAAAPALRPGCPFAGLRVGGTVLPAEVLRAAVAEGVRGGMPFLLAVTEGAARPADRLGPWEVAACEVRRLHGTGWHADLPPFGPSWHPEARAVAAWVRTILPARETAP